MKLSRKQLRTVKKALKESNETHDEESEAELEETQKTLKEIRALYLSDEDNREAVSKIKANRQIKKNLKRSARKEKKVLISWNLNTGDAVKFINGDEIMIGIIVKQQADGEYRNAREAKARSTVLVLTHAGSFWLNPKHLEKIDEEDA